MNDHKIYKAMLAIQNEIDAIGKNKTNAQQGFKFRGIDDVYNTVHPLLSKHGVFSVPRVTNSKYETYVNAKGNRATSVYLAVEYTFYAEDGSSVICAVASEGTDYADKATNKAMSFAHKYAILQIFSIPTDDIIDGDADSPNKNGVATHKPTPKEIDKAISAAATTQELNEIYRKFVEPFYSGDDAQPFIDKLSIRKKELLEAVI